MRPIYVAFISEFFPENAVKTAQKIAEKFGFEVRGLALEKPKFSADFEIEISKNWAEDLATADAAMVVFENRFSRKELKTALRLSRELRQPYLFVPSAWQSGFEKVEVPVTFLEEDREKAIYAAAFGVHFGSKIRLLVAKDYGTKARRNADAMASLLSQRDVDFTKETGAGDSFSVEAESLNAGDLAIISASREYGLDDWLFGPKELKLLLKARTAVMLVNPRGDLYALCD